MTIAEILQEAKSLTLRERKELVKLLLDSFATDEPSEQPKTGAEIVANLVISPETVKKHATAIYGKLGVRSRTEAVARARTLDLLN